MFSFILVPPVVFFFRLLYIMWKKIASVRHQVNFAAFCGLYTAPCRVFCFFGGGSVRIFGKCEPLCGDANRQRRQKIFANPLISINNYVIIVINIYFLNYSHFVPHLTFDNYIPVYYMNTNF